MKAERGILVMLLFSRILWWARKRELAKFLRVCEAQLSAEVACMYLQSRELRVRLDELRDLRETHMLRGENGRRTRHAKNHRDAWPTAGKRGLRFPSYLAVDGGVLAHALFGEVLHDCAWSNKGAWWVVIESGPVSMRSTHGKAASPGAGASRAATSCWSCCTSPAPGTCSRRDRLGNTR